MGKKNKKKSDEDPKENKPPNDSKGKGSENQSSGSGNQSGEKKKESDLQHNKEKQQGDQTSSKQQGAWGNKGPQQSGGQGGQQRQQQNSAGSQHQGQRQAGPSGQGQQQGSAGHQQQGGWSTQSQRQGGPRGQERPQQSGAGQQQQAGWSNQGQRQGGPSGQERPQQGGARPQQQGGWPNKGQQQGGSSGQERPQQGGARPQQQGGWPNKGQQQGGSRGQERPQQGGAGHQQQAGWPNQSQGQGGQRGQERPQQGGAGYQQQEGWSNQGQRQGGPSGQERPHHGGARPQQQGGWPNKGQQQGGQRGQDRQQAGGARPQQHGGYPQQGGYPQHVGTSGNAIVRVPAPPNSIPRGTLGKKFEVETNYLLLNLDKMPDTAYHYDVKVDPDRPKKFLREAFDAYVRKVFPKYDLAYDGKANAYSAVLLPEDQLGSEITVEVDEKGRKIPFKVTLKATDDIEIDLKSLKAYHKERVFDKPMRALQCIEVVLSTPCHKKGIRAGRSFFREPASKIDLGDGFELWYGLYQAAMLCDQPLLNVDVSHKSFPSRVNLVDFFERSRDQSARTLTDLLKGLRVTYKPPACFKSTEKDFKFVKVMDSSSKQTFKNENGETLTIEKYFASKGYQLKKPHLPCLHVGSTVKNIYIPLELLEVPPGQAIMRKDNENQVRQMIRHAATSTDVRKEKIFDLLRSFDYYIHPTVERFGLSVGRSFITVAARLLSSPAIEYSGGAKINIEKPGEWANRNVLFYKCDNKSIHEWAIINIAQNRDINTMFLKENFVDKIGREANKLGLKLNFNCSEIKEISPRGRGPVSILPELRAFKTKKISIVFVILPYFSDAYAKVKQEAELSCGIVTQCIKGETIRSFNKRFNSIKVIDQMTIGNILLKVNAKLNGINHKISPTNEISLQKSKVMFVGADVSHPSPLQTNLPSIVGVVASHDLYGTQYNMQYRLQTAKLETIEDMKNIMTQHLNCFKTFTGSLPDNIVYYRDGVSDGQFPLVKNIEVTAMRAACTAMKCKAKFTVIIVVKRHHTRFFPKGSDGENKFNNVKAGTVVDQTICHPNEVQFFLVSHKAIQGTSKPTRYNVIIDDANINIDDLQAMTYNLCHLFPRCNRSVSYPAPAYLAHLVGLRGRAYIEGSNLNLENLKGEYSKRIVSNDVMKFNPMYFV